MPEKKTMRRANRDRREGKSAGTQAGEFVREEMEHVKKGKHGAKSRAQAIAIGLSKARRSGVDVPERGTRSKRGGSQKRGRRLQSPRTNAKRSRASEGALKRMGRPKLRGPEARASARKAANTRKRNTAGKRGGSARKSR
jgi:hypothetical protein